MPKNSVKINTPLKVFYKRDGTSAKGHWTMLVVNSAGTSNKNDIVIWAGKSGDAIYEGDSISIQKITSVNFYQKCVDPNLKKFQPKCEIDAEVEKVVGLDELPEVNPVDDLSDMPSDWLNNDGELPY